MPIGSRNEIELLAWGSRSRRSVFDPRRANAAARLMAVVVLPTPPFWLVIAIINFGKANCQFACESTTPVSPHMDATQADSPRYIGKSLASPITSGHSSSPAAGSDSASSSDTEFREA